MTVDLNTLDPDFLKGFLASLGAALATLIYSAKWMLLIMLMSTTACGLKAGTFVAGSTSYLREANRGLQIESALEDGLSMHKPHTDEDKRQLTRVLRGAK